MRKKLLSLLVAVWFLFVGALSGKAETPRPSVSAVKMSTKSTVVNAVKLKKTESVVKKGKAVRKQVLLDCLDRLD